MNREKLIDELVRDEGLRLRLYTDSEGNFTVGIGRNLKAKGISKDEAYRMCNNDIEEALALLDQYLPWWRGLDEVRQRVLVNMTFNMGLAPSNPPGERGLWEFQKTLSFIRSGAYDFAATEMLDSKWARQVGPRAIRLADMMRRGTT